MIITQLSNLEIFLFLVVALRTPSPRSSVNDRTSLSSNSIGNHSSMELPHNGSNILEEDFVNLEYLKHVIIKFLTSREYEVGFYIYLLSY